MPPTVQSGHLPHSMRVPVAHTLHMGNLQGIMMHPSQHLHEQQQQQQHDGTDAEMEAHMPEAEDMREGDDKTDEDAEDSDTNTKRVGNKARKPHLQGRFSGRLETKADEKRLADECKLLGHLLGGVGKRGEKSRLTLAKIVRGIATGDVRRHCESREAQLQVSYCGGTLQHNPSQTQCFQHSMLLYALQHLHCHMHSQRLIELQQLKQQLKGYEQNGFLAVQPDPDTKMIPVQGFRSDQQQLAAAIGGKQPALFGNVRPSWLLLDDMRGGEPPRLCMHATRVSLPELHNQMVSATVAHCQAILQWALHRVNGGNHPGASTRWLRP